MCTIKTKEGRVSDNNGKRNYGKGNGARATKVGPFPCRSAWCRSPSSGRSPPCIGNTRVSLAGIWLGIFDHVSLIFKHSLRAWKMRSGKTDRIWPPFLMQGQILCSTYGNCKSGMGSYNHKRVSERLMRKGIVTWDGLFDHAQNSLFSFQ